MAKESDVKLQEKFIKYVGLADVRIIRKESWAKIGIDHKDVVWDKNNGWKVKASDLSEQVLEYCNHDRELVVVEE